MILYNRQLKRVTNLTHYKCNGGVNNVTNFSSAQLEELGLKEITIPKITEYQELIPLDVQDWDSGEQRVRDFSKAEIDIKLSDAKKSKIAQVKAELIQLAKDTYWNLDNTKTKEQIITIAKNRFNTKKSEINALTTIQDINNYLN